ncbi:B-box zinc finger protein 22-like [Oryza brachyantha]|uniref:B-box zinc finger protein 22-like n=1 Tax=Oryza brachyantha TaxID=4533 RepID=UPI001ADCD80C|nr:B-box zinc finger protein 22-like [Oryza brachyantha]
MKIGCDACEQAEAAVLCCADEAALCRRCDAAVHSANRLAGKHHRVALLLPASAAGTVGPSPAAAAGDDVHPTCDICQEKTGYFFCLEDRALLCRSCDVAVHTATPHVAAHRRFLITGVRIGDSVDATATACAADDVSSSIAPAGSASSNHAVAGDGRSPPPAPPPAARFSGDDDIELEQQWPWSDVFADDDDVSAAAAMEQCYAGMSEPHSSSLTG